MDFLVNLVDELQFIFDAVSRSLGQRIDQFAIETQRFTNQVQLQVPGYFLAGSD